MGGIKEAVHAVIHRAMETERAVGVISIPCSPNEVLAVQYRTPGVIVTLYHKSTSHEICVCVGTRPAELRMYRYTSNPDEKRTPVRFNSKYGIKIRETVSEFDSHQPLMVPTWVSYFGPPLNLMVSPYETVVVFSDIRNLVIDRISGQQSINVPAGTVVSPVVMWFDEYRVNYNFVCMIDWESNVHNFYVSYGSSFVGMFTDAVYPQRMLSDVPTLLAKRGETRVMDPTMIRNERLCCNNWNNINDMGRYMGVIAYNVQLIGLSDFKRSFLNLKGKVVSKDKNQAIVGVSREIANTETDSSAAFHVIRHLSLDVAGGFHSVTMGSYVCKPTFGRGGRTVGGMQSDLTGKPPRGFNIQNWAYRLIVAEIEAGTTDSAGTPVLTNSLAGADLVYADPPDAV